jgi:hypothetical protein
MIVNRPVAFPGTEEEKAANFRTHHFIGIDRRCMDCDCKTWHVAADYPCGTEPPREVAEETP